jgi:hypothetical protein
MSDNPSFSRDGAREQYLLDDIARTAMTSLMGAQDEYLRKVVDVLGITPQEFVDQYELEYKTIETEYDTTFDDSIHIRFRQEFRIKLKEQPRGN